LFVVVRYFAPDVGVEAEHSSIVARNSSKFMLCRGRDIQLWQKFH